MLSILRSGGLAAMFLLITATADQSAQAQFGSRFTVAPGVNQRGFGESALWLNQATWGDAWAQQQAAVRPWHGDYYYLKTGQPTALIVPPTIRMQQNYSWGVSQNTMLPVYHQFSGGPAPASPPGVFYATPYWPSHTNQFGVYPVRAPW